MKDQIISFSHKLISIPSHKDSPSDLQRVLDVARSEVSDYPYKSYSQDGKPSLLIYNHWPEDGRFHVLFNAHLDIVPAREEQFSAKVVDGRLIGRGAIDMKAAAAAEILAFKHAASTVGYPLALQLVTDEEVGGKKGAKYQIAQGVLTDFYLCGEYSDLGIGYQTKGVLWIKLITTGVRAHGAFLWNGTNAITKISREITSVSKLFPVPKKEIWKTTCNFGQITGGIAVNQVPDEASVTLDIRRVPTQTADEIISTIKSHLVYPDTRLEIIENEPANLADKNNYMVRDLAASIREVTGHPPRFVRFHGASDARHYSAAGCTALDIGPTGDGLHSDYEWCDIQSLVSYYSLLENFLHRIDKTPLI